MFKRKEPNFAFLRQAALYALSMPEEQFNLDRIAEGSSLTRAGKVEAQHATCGTVCCAMGWIGTMPEAQDRGVVTTYRHAKIGALYILPDTEADKALRPERMMDMGVFYSEAAAFLFNITEDEAEELFCPAGDSRYDKSDAGRALHSLKDDRDLFRHRVNQFLSEQGQPSLEETL